MSFSDTLFQGPVTALPFAELATGMLQLAVLGAVLMFFRPLLIGIARALVLVVRPRLTKDELAARRTLQQAKTALQAQADAPDVRAVGSRS
jgi:hypothetical protein